MTALAPAARTWRGWVQAVRRRPGPLVTLYAGVVGGTVALAQLDTELARQLTTGLWIFSGSVHRATTQRVLERSGPLTSVERLRAPVDVTTASPVHPQWRWSGLLGRWLLVAAVPAAGVVAVCGFFVVDALRDGSSAALFAAAVLSVGVLVGLGGLWVALVAVPGACRYVVRHGTPTVVRVVGIEHLAQQWHVEPVDGGDVVVLGAFRGRSRLVAGDVVHLWTAPSREAPYEHRVAVTGPFGVLWAALPDPVPASESADQAVDEVRG